jgi:hypothetical protein
LLRVSLCIEALIAVFSAPERYDELWKAYMRQVRTVELGVSPLTDRVLYCMVTICTYSVCKQMRLSCVRAFSLIS